MRTISSQTYACILYQRPYRVKKKVYRNIEVRIPYDHGQIIICIFWTLGRSTERPIGFFQQKNIRVQICSMHVWVWYNNPNAHRRLPIKKIHP